MMREKSILDLLALVAILTTAVVLVLAGVQPETLAGIAIALTSLFGAWLRRDGPEKQREKTEGAGATRRPVGRR
jgi:streptomycin 6-kinase